VFALHAYATPQLADAVVAELQGCADVRHIVLSGVTTDTGKALITAEVQAASADEVLRALQQLGLPSADLSIARLQIARPLGPDGPVADAIDDQDALVWAQVNDEAVENVGLHWSSLVYMAVAGIVAAFGVTEHSAILIVGAMAVSPDLLPVSAACVALVGRRGRLFGRAFGTLLPGLLVTVVAALLVTLGLRAAGLVAAGLDIDSGVVYGLAHVNTTTVVVALAAGVAGMLSFETRASFAVGVAISVTTIPAAAYVGVAAGLGQWRGALGAAAVLLVNIAMLLLAGTLTLALQWRWSDRGERRLH
jgi:uncharacterized hydrophobic protein (TIGR00271 family)